MLAVALLSVVAGTPIRGVNLGGWLVLEPWITPQLFETANDGVPRTPDGRFSIVDEYTWRAAPAGHQDRSALLAQHWREWVQEDHIDALHKAGITHLRVPVGYWYWNISAGEPFAATAGIHAQALDALQTMANQWAAPRGMRVLIDLHTAPGSQNGFDNSGRRAQPNTRGINFTTAENLAHWEGALRTIAQWSVKNIQTLFGVEVMNEPGGMYPDIWDVVTKTVNPTGYAAVRAASPDVAVVFQSAFHSFADEPTYAEPGFHNVYIDQHTYYCFAESDADEALTPEGWELHLNEACAESRNYAEGSTFRFAGEWSLAVTDCTIYLAGGMNANCDMQAHPDCKYNASLTRMGHDDVCQYYNRPADQMAPEYKDFLQKFARAQMDSFEVAGGWFFWNFRTENGHAPAWDYLLGVQEGWMPANAAGRTRYCPTPSIVV